MVTFQHIGAAADRFAEGEDVLCVVEDNRDESQQVITLTCPVNFDGELRDGAGSFQFSDPLHHRGDGKVDLPGNFRSGGSCVELQLV